MLDRAKYSKAIKADLSISETSGETFENKIDPRQVHCKLCHQSIVYCTTENVPAAIIVLAQVVADNTESILKIGCYRLCSEMTNHIRYQVVTEVLNEGRVLLFLPDKSHFPTVPSALCVLCCFIPTKFRADKLRSGNHVSRMASIHVIV